jgi:hypothetical protein
MLKNIIADLALSPIWQQLTLAQKKEAVRYVFANISLTSAEAIHGSKISPEGVIVGKNNKKMTQ